MKHKKAELHRVTDLVQQLSSLDEVIAEHRRQDDARAHFVLPQYEERRQRLVKDMLALFAKLMMEEAGSEKTHQVSLDPLLYVLSALIVKFISKQEMLAALSNWPTRNSRTASLQARADMKDLEVLLAGV